MLFLPMEKFEEAVFISFGNVCRNYAVFSKKTRPNHKL
jgi:hypothetical protein